MWSLTGFPPGNKSCIQRWLGNFSNWFSQGFRLRIHTVTFPWFSTLEHCPTFLPYMLSFKFWSCIASHHTTTSLITVPCRLCDELREGLDRRRPLCMYAFVMVMRIVMGSCGHPETIRMCEENTDCAQVLGSMVEATWGPHCSHQHSPSHARYLAM